jgi:hypothetical protein
MVAVASALVALPIAIAAAVVFIALVVMGGMRQRQKRFSERRANAGQLRTGAEERTERAGHDRESVRKSTERAGGIDQDP